jgi:hypothetical protein
MDAAHRAAVSEPSGQTFPYRTTGPVSAATEAAAAADDEEAPD